VLLPTIALATRRRECAASCLNQRRNRRVGEGRHAANVDLAKSVLLLSGVVSFPQQKVGVPKHRKGLGFNPNSTTQLVQPFVFQASSQVLEAEIVLIAVETLTRQRRASRIGGRV
jgi:hypothetical protein